MIDSLISSTIKSVPHPMIGKPNLTIVYAIANGAFEIDESTGNEIETERTVAIKASVRKSDSGVNSQDSVGTGFYEMKIEGRLVSPKMFPASVDTQSIASATLEDAFSKSAIKGEFRLLPIVQHRSAEFTRQRGQYIEGVLTVKGAV